MQKEEILKSLIHENHFVIYHMPGTKVIRIISSSSLLKVTDLNELTVCSKGFIFAPFYIDEFPTYILTNSKSWELPYVETVQSTSGNESLSFPDPSYQSTFKKFHDKVTAGDFSKLVLARTKDITTDVNPIELFWNTCQRYPNAMVYLFQSKEAGTWLGATPELLLEGDAVQMHTVALAGTMKCVNGTIPKLSDWSEKNKKEQQIVTDYIRECIRSYGELKDEWGPYSCKAADLAHLKTDLYFRLAPEKMPDLLSLLHPTPAVCGLPKQKALQFIKETEPHKRSYYAGFLGWYEPYGKTQLYVNLRCLTWEQPSQIQLFAGGGILHFSSIENEWKETEIKMQTLLQAIQNINPHIQ